MQAYRGSILHLLEDPTKTTNAEAVAFHEDGLLLVEGGRVAGCQPCGGEIHHTRTSPSPWRAGVRRCTASAGTAV